MNVIHAVILPTPGQGPERSSRERVESQQVAARQALAQAAKRQGLVFHSLPRDEHGAPRAVDGQHWSISHTSAFVGGAAASWPIGIDIECVRSARPEVVAAAASQAELDMISRRFGEVGDEAFTRIWSAKEALLKLTGEGLGGLSRAIVGPSTDLERRPGLWIRHGQQEHFVHQVRRGSHIASLTCAPASHVDWNWQEQPAPSPSLA